ncbi:MAG: hypothetical protein LBS35_06865 [Synergistaceae bacterium]|nr:hypothetical protein [Synergistaceae bacterium]
MAENAEDILMFFDEEHPYWTEEMFALVGQDSGTLKDICGKGLLRRRGGVYFLTPEGAERFRREAENNFSPLCPGLPETNMTENSLRREAMRGLLWLLVDTRHLQRWGLKEYSLPFRFDLPGLREEDIFSLERGKLTWRYAEQPVFRKMALDFPVSGLAARRHPAPSPERVTAWKMENMPVTRTMEVDLLYKSRYDFQSYAHFPPMPCDPCRLLNTDRFLCFFAPPHELPSSRTWLLTILGEFQMFLTMLRRMYLPGYVDFDGMDIESSNWLIYVYEKTSDARICAEIMAPFGESLAGPAAPLDVWSLSFEMLWEHNIKAESIHDLFPAIAYPLYRVIAKTATHVSNIGGGA